MVTKVYKLKKKTAAYFETRYCGVVVPMHFSVGASSDGNNAELVVVDRFVQDAIEHDPRFGKLFVLAAKYGKEEPVADAIGTVAGEPAADAAGTVAESGEKKQSRKRGGRSEKKDMKEFKTLNDAIYYLEEEIGVETNDGNIEALMQQYGICVK